MVQLNYDFIYAASAFAAVNALAFSTFNGVDAAALPAPYAAPEAAVPTYYIGTVGAMAQSVTADSTPSTVTTTITQTGSSSAATVATDAASSASTSTTVINSTSGTTTAATSTGTVNSDSVEVADGNGIVQLSDNQLTKVSDAITKVGNSDFTLTSLPCMGSNLQFTFLSQKAKINKLYLFKGNDGNPISTINSPQYIDASTQDLNKKEYRKEYKGKGISFVVPLPAKNSIADGKYIFGIKAVLAGANDKTSSLFDISKCEVSN